MITILHSSVSLKLILFATILQTPALMMEIIDEADLTSQDPLKKEGIDFQVEMKILASDNSNEETESSWVQDYTFGNFLVSDFAQKVQGVPGFLSQYTFTENMDQEWDFYVENGKSLSGLKYDRDSLKEDVSVQINRYGLLRVSSSYHFLMSLYKNCGWRSLKLLLDNNTHLKQRLKHPSERMVFYSSLAKMWSSLVNAQKRICISSPEGISIDVRGFEEGDHIPRFRYPEMSVDFSQPCHHFDPAYSSKAVIENDVNTLASKGPMIELFNFARLVFYIEAMIGSSISQQDSSGDQFLNRYDAFETQIKIERAIKEFGNETLNQQIQYLEEEVFKMYEKDNDYLFKSGDEPAKTYTAYKSLYSQLKTIIQADASLNSNLTFDLLEKSLSSYINTIRTEINEEMRSRNIILV